MLPISDTHRCLKATLLMLMLVVAAPFDAQERGLPDAGGVVEGYLKVRAWVNDFSLPDEESPESRVVIDRAAAVCVILRHSGTVMGEGVDATFDDRSIRRAARRALNAVYGHPRLADMPIDMRPQIGRNLVLELEVAGEMIPLVGDTFDEAAAVVEPGLDGIAMRVGDTWLLRFPAQMRADNTSARAPSIHMQMLISELNLRRKSLREHRAQDGLAVYRFRTLHLTQRTPTDNPFTTFRGQSIISRSHVHRDSLQEFGEFIAHHMMELEWGRLQTGPGRVEIGGRVIEFPVQPDRNPPLGMLGTYHPTRDAYDPLIAPPFDQALTSYALSYFAKTRAFRPEIAGRAAAFAEQLLFELTDVVEIEGFSEVHPLSDPAATAMIVIAGRELYRLTPRRAVVELITEATGRTWNQFDPEHGVFRRVQTADGRERELRPDEQAVIAAAMMRLAIAAPPTPDALDIARQALDSAWASVDAVDHPSLLPWIGWGELDYSLLAGDAPRSEELAAIREVLRQSQLVEQSAAGAMRPIAPDVEGGYLLAGPTGTRATAQGLRPAAWTARLLSNRQEVSDEHFLLELGRQMRFMRFVMQLSVTGADTWAYPNPGRAMGGIRLAPWDSTQPLQARALALIVICDIMRGLERVDKMR